MHGKHEGHSTVKTNPNTKTVKAPQSTKPMEGFTLTNSALNTYVYEYIKPPSEGMYSLLSEGCKKPEQKKASKKQEIKPSNILSSLLASLVDTVSIESMEAPEEERRARRVTNRLEPVDISGALEEMLKGVLEETEKEGQKESTDYTDILEKVEKMNRQNRELLMRSRRVHLAHDFYRGLMEKIDGSIENTFKKLKKKKKKEEETNYYQELEDLIEKRKRIKDLCKSLPREMDAGGEEAPVCFLRVSDILSEKELETVQDVLPRDYMEAWES
ncbi:uncharacterized protein NEMAJ01_1527 [Nematocida major]|uniref:uncharacterized protein n=1 Tax=Nematocida major TaxID=1912982 RepID=UPI002007CA59|nr:uncharacterized protein NEMAJ01_1527 [Nematocida major]KAH9386631.1 hypothetical protein NEMAJ01_1527 [Nematocida major]